MDKLAPTTVDPLSKANLYDGINTNLATLKYAPPQLTKISVLRFRAPGYHLTIGDSDTDLALEAVETIKTQSKNPQAEFMYVNLASLEDICKLVNEIEQHASVIDMLAPAHPCIIVNYMHPHLPHSSFTNSHYFNCWMPRVKHWIGSGARELRTITYLCLSNKVEAISGKYWLDEHIRPCNPIARDAELQEELEM
ncbi:hypothetical protein BGZ93_010603 [Podila epicladia]|nr:hypothetical protein BGZ93_010603 [Podila epicladia]